MRWPAIAVALLGMGLLVGLADRAGAQASPPSESVKINAPKAWTWKEGQTDLLQLQGPVTIELDRTKLSADQAVIWLTPAPGLAGQQQAEIALLGHARLEQQGIVRSGGELFVTARIAGAVQLTAEQRLTANQSQTALYRQAGALRAAQGPGVRPKPLSPWILERPGESGPTTAPAPPAPDTAPVPVLVQGRVRDMETLRTEDGKIAGVISGGVVLVRQRPDGGLLTLQSDRVVVFTEARQSRELFDQRRGDRLEAVLSGVYLEGDVRITLTPGGEKPIEQHLEANRAYYEFATDRAILTDAVVHSIEPRTHLPVIIRARKVRQLAEGEYTAQKVEVTTSGFATPSYSLNASKVYVRSEPGDELVEQRTLVEAKDATMRFFGVPAFYLPAVGAEVTAQGLPIRSAALVSSHRFGVGETSRWGLFESLGRPSPRGLDASFRADYFSDRGPAVGLDATYNGGFVTETTKSPWNFTGEFNSYLIDDHGIDDLGRANVDPPQDLRYQFLWEHQHFFPNDWQVQVRAGTVSDPTFLEEWFPRDYYNGQPRDLSLYVKRQRNIDAATFAIDYQPLDFVTTADSLQEQFQVDRLPEIGYHRIGDSWMDDRLTFFSDNSFSGLQFSRSKATLPDQGFVNGLSPGLPSVGQTGTIGDTVYRGYFRQEVDYPVSAGPFRVVPYVMGIYAPYSDSPTGKAQNRLYGGTGLKLTTAFWKVDDSANSDLFDIHRVRHVIEPEVNLFTSGQTVDRGDLFIYDEPIDPINDVSAAQLALRQRWQTKRGGPGRWRSVDFFSLNIEANFFANQPTDAQLAPTNFRGLFYPSLPEASIPRNSINSDATWRISDTTALLADAAYNLDTRELATASIGLAVRRDPRLSYFLGTRYIQAAANTSSPPFTVHSAITTVAADYELSRKYSLAVAQSYDFGAGDTVGTSIMVIRRFDRFFAAFRFYYDARSHEKGFTINLYPEGLGATGRAMPGLFGE